MAYDIGPRIGIEGEAEFRKAISDINTNMKTLGTEMQAVASQFDKNDKSAEALTAQNEVLNKQIVAQKQKLTELQKGLSASADKYGENDKVTQGWQQAINKATADLNDMERELKSNNEALNDSGKAAEDSGNKFEKFGGVLKGVGVAMGAVAVAAGAAAVKLASKVVKSFGKLEQNLGGSETVFGEYAKSIQKTGEEAYKNLGVSQSNYLATANKMGALFQGSGIEQRKSLELTEQAMQRAADMASVMGIDMQVALDSVSGAAKGNFTMMDNLGVAMNATNIEAYALSKGLDFTWKTASQAEKAEMAMQMFFDSTSQYAGNFAKESTTTVTGSIGLLQAALGSFTAGLGNTDADMQNLTENLVDAFKTVIENIVPIIKNITAALPSAFDAILTAIGELLPTLLDTAIVLFKQVLDTLLKLLPELIPVVVQALLTIVDTLIENLPMIINGALVLIMALANGLIEALPELIPAVVDTVLTIVEALIDNIDMLIDAAIAIIMALADGLIAALPTLIDKMPIIIDKLITALSENMPKLIEAGIQLIIALAGGLIKAIPQLVSKIPEIVTSIVEGFISYYSRLFDIGKDMVKGIWEGIKAMGQWIKDKVSDFFGGIVDGVKGLLGIQSPSKVFAGIGENMALGLGEGFDAEMKNIGRKINSSIPTEIDTQLNVNGRGFANGGSDYEKIGEGIVNGLAGIMPRVQGGPITINVVLQNGKELAEVVFDPLIGISKQRGVAFG